MGPKPIVGDVNPETYMRFGNLGTFKGAAYVSYIPTRQLKFLYKVRYKCM